MGRGEVCQQLPGGKSVRRGVLYSAFVLGLSLVASPCYADRAFWTGDVPPAPASRATQAREWLEGFRALDRQIPTLSPSESAWLKREYDDQIASASGRFTSRAIAATDSTEYHKRVAGEHLDKLLLVVGTLATSERLAEQQEIRLWIALATAMMDSQFWQSVKVLVERKLVSPEINGVKEFYLQNHVGWAQTILNRVVLPMMEKSVR